MNPNYTIRFAEVDDAFIITQHRRKMFTDMGEQNYIESTSVDSVYQQWLEAKLARGDYVGWLMMHHDAVIGGAGVEIRERGPRPGETVSRYAYVVNVFVEPEYRQQGIARQLLTTLIDWCAQEGLRTITLHASDKGRHLYETLGFEQTNEMHLVL
jgi:GNAT superfamily N-acetyltransferase